MNESQRVLCYGIQIEKDLEDAQEMLEDVFSSDELELMFEEDFIQMLWSPGYEERTGIIVTKNLDTYSKSVQDFASKLSGQDELTWHKKWVNTFSSQDLVDKAISAFGPPKFTIELMSSY